MWMLVGRIHKKDLGLLKLDQQATAVQLVLITRSLEAAEVEEPFVGLYRTVNIVWSHLQMTRSVCLFLYS